ncbi:MAG: hypothetical protein Q9195_005744 [Heterodermia aff. obscurata]
MAKSKRKAKKRKLEDDSDHSEDEELDIQFLTTDPKSPFVHMDLIAEYSSPEFQALLTDQDKIEIAELLPDHIGLTNEGFFEDSFIRYDMDFKQGIRMYQQDLEAGRYDPEWLRQAAEAMDRRANGDFDAWKEQEYEEFWGQKQKLDTKARAGQSGTIKLNRLIEAGLFREGDVFSYNRTFGRGKGKLTVEKDVKIVEIDGTTMTFAIPPAQLKYARRLAPDEDSDEKPKNGEIDDTPAAEKIAESNNADDNDAKDIKAKSNNAEDTKVMNDTAEDNKIENDNGEAKSSDLNEIEGKRATPRPCDADAPSMASPSPAPSSQLSDIPPDVDDVILASITTLQALEDKIVTIDGRLGKKVDGNAFKSIRVKRDNQDLGSLFEIREEWYVYKY